MGRPDASRRFFAIGLKYTPRVVAGILALFSLLVSHQLIWSAFAGATREFGAPRIWLLTGDDDADLFASLGTRGRPPLTTTQRDLEVRVVAPPGLPVEILENGNPVSSDPLSGGLARVHLQLRKGRNYVVARSTAPRAEGTNEQTAILAVDYQAVDVAEPRVIAWQQLQADGPVQVFGFGEPGATVFLRRDSGSEPAMELFADEVGAFIGYLPPPPPGVPLLITTSSRTALVQRATSEPPLTPISTGSPSASFQLVSATDRVQRVASFTVGTDRLIVHATAVVPSGTELHEMLSSHLLNAGEFLRDVFGLCFDSAPGESDRLGSLGCFGGPSRASALDASPQTDADGDVTLDLEVPLPASSLTLRYFPRSAVARTFLSMPGDVLRVDREPGAIDRVRLRGTGYRDEAAAAIWDTAPAAPTVALFTDGVVFDVAPAANATSAPADPPDGSDGPPGEQAATPKFIDRIRALEEMAPAKVRAVFGTLLAAVPFLYVLWLLHAFPVGPRAPVATLRAVTQTFLVLHLSILAAAFFEASFFTSSAINLLELVPRDSWWTRGARVLVSATYIYPFLAIGIVMLVRPMFRALRRAALAPPRRPHRALRALGWLAFWLGVVAIPGATVWAGAAQLDPDAGMAARLAPIGLALAAGFGGLWIVLFWLFRGVLRIGVGARHSMQASWAMLLLPVVPLTVDGVNGVARGVIATKLHIYPFMLPEQASPYVANAIVAVLGAILLRQVGTLSIRLTEDPGAYRWWRAHRLAILVAALIISVPVATGYAGNVFGFTSFLRLVDNLLPYALLIGIALLVRLYNPSDRFDIPPALVHVGALLFAWYVTTGGASLLFIPVPFLMAWVLFRRWLITPQPAAAPATATLLAAFLDERRARSRLESLQKGLDKKVSEGELKLADYTARLREGETSAQASAAVLALATGGAPARVFGSGPEAGPWGNARMAVLYGMVISAPFQLFTLVRMMNNGWGSGAFPLLEFAFALLYSVVTWAVTAAVFGYFFHLIRGRNGFEKALSFSLCAVLPAIPLRLVTTQSIVDRGQILDIIQVVAFTLVLALVAFDLRTLQKHRYGWRDLMSVYGLASAAYGSTIALALASALGGKDVIAQIWSFIKGLAQ